MPFSRQTSNPGRRALAAATGLLAATLLWLCAVQAALAGVPVKAALMLNMSTGRLLYQKNVDMLIPPASLTKLMTSLLVHEALAEGRLSLGTKVRVSSEAANVGGSSMRLRAGEHVTVDQLLQGTMISSGNDAATALALKVSGREKNFVDAMNTKARRLGMKNTRFKNPTGLPAAGQVTTARDLMRLASAYLRKYPRSSRYHSQKSYSWHGQVRGTTNPFLGRKGVNGLKTGFTLASGYNIILTAERGNTRLLVILLGASSKGNRLEAGNTLLDAGFKHPNNARLVRTTVDGEETRSLATTTPQKPQGSREVKKAPESQPKKQGRTQSKQTGKDRQVREAGPNTYVYRMASVRTEADARAEQKRYEKKGFRVRIARSGKSWVLTHSFQGTDRDEKAFLQRVKKAGLGQPMRVSKR